jgi:hypothetical protein
VIKLIKLADYRSWHNRRQSIFGPHLHFLDHGEAIKRDQLLAILCVHVIPHVDKAHFNHLELAIPLLEQRVPLRLVLLLDAFYFFCVLLNQRLRLYH